MSAELITSLDEKYISNSIIFDAMIASVTLFLEGEALRDATGELDRRAIRARIDGATWAAPALRKRLRRAPLGLAPAAWVPVDHFDLEYHVQFHPGVLSYGPDTAAILAGRSAGRLDRERPVWRILFVELSSGDLALVFSWHHVMGDAAYGLQTLRLLFDEARSPAIRAATPAQRALLGRAPRTGAGLLAHLGVEWWRGHATTAERWAAYRSRPFQRRVRRWGARLLRSPRDEVIRLRRLSERIPDRHYRLVSFDLEEAQRLAAYLGGSVHDLTVAATFKACWDAMPGLEEAALLVPISRRKGAVSGGARNVVTTVRVVVPVGLELREIAEAVRSQVRRGLGARGAAAAPRLGYATMVPSGEQDRFFGPAPIRAVAGWPVTDPADAVGVLATSYADTLTFAVSTFVTIDIDTLIDSIRRSLLETVELR